MSQLHRAVVLDLRLPDMSGLEALEILTRYAPVTVLTGHGDIDLAVAAMKGGAIDFMRKPVLADELVACLNILTNGLSERGTTPARQPMPEMPPHDRVIATPGVSALIASLIKTIQRTNTSHAHMAALGAPGVDPSRWTD